MFGLKKKVSKKALTLESTYVNVQDLELQSIKSTPANFIQDKNETI